MKLKLERYQKGVCPLCNHPGLIAYHMDRTYFCPMCAKHFSEEFLMNRQPVEEWKQNQRDAEKMLKAWELNQEAHQKLQELLRPGLQPLMPTPTPTPQEQSDKDAFAFQFNPKLMEWKPPKPPKPTPPKQLLIELRGGPMDGAKWTMPADVTGAYKLAWPEGAEYRPEFDSIDNLWHYTYYGPEDLP